MVITRTPTKHARVFEIAAYGPDDLPVAVGHEPQIFVDDDRVASRRGGAKRRLAHS